MSSSQSKGDLNPEPEDGHPMLRRTLHSEDEELEWALRLSQMSPEESDRQLAQPNKFPMSTTIGCVLGLQTVLGESPAVSMAQNDTHSNACADGPVSQETLPLPEQPLAQLKNPVEKPPLDEEMASIRPIGQALVRPKNFADSYAGSLNEDMFRVAAELPPDVAKRQLVLSSMKYIAAGNFPPQSVLYRLIRLLKQFNTESTSLDETMSGLYSSLMELLASLVDELPTRMNDPEELMQIETAAEHFDEGMKHYMSFKDGSRALPDIDKAIELFQDAIEFLPEDHHAKTIYLRNLGCSLGFRFECLGKLGDINKAIQVQQQAVALMPDGHADKPRCLNNLGWLYSCCFEHLGGLEDIEKAIQAQQQAVALAPDGHIDKLAILNNLGGSYTRRFERLEDLEDIKKAIQVLKQVVALTPDGHSNKPGCLNNLGGSYNHRFERLGDQEDIEKAIQVLQQAVALTPEGHADRPRCLNSLGGSYACRFGSLGNVQDIEKAIQVQQQAVALTLDEHPGRPGHLNNLGSSYTCRFECLGDLEDIYKAIQVRLEAIALTPDGHPGKAGCLNNLGGSYTRRFEHLGDLEDIDKAIQVQQQAVLLTPDGHPDKPGCLNNLGGSYIRRFEHLGDQEDIEKAIQIQQQTVALIPDSHADRPTCLNNLGNTYTCRFECLRDLEDIYKAIQVQELAILLTPDGHPGKPGCFNNLGGSYNRRFECLGKLGDINKAIQVQQQAVLLTPDGHPDKPGCLNNLGGSYIRRFERLGDLEDINKAIQVLKHAVALTPGSHSDKPGHLSNLGNSFTRRFEHLGDLEDIDKAIEIYGEAATSPCGPPSDKFRSARHWTLLAARRRPKLSADKLLAAYKILIQLLPEVIWLGTPVDKRFTDIREIVGESVNLAVSLAIEAQRYELAVEWLDQGRSIVWGQVLHLRSPLDELRLAHPHLAHELEQTSQQLESASLRSFQLKDGLIGDNLDASFSLEEQAQIHRRTAEKREQVLSEIRSLPDFANFLKAEPFSTLSQVATFSNPIILINVSAYRCDALVLLSSQTDLIIHIPLSDFSMNISYKLLFQMESVCSTRNVRCSENKGVRKSCSAPFEEVQPLQALLGNLWTLIVSPILQEIEHVIVDNAGNIPRITWCTTGHLSFLPLHAAGIYGSSDPAQDTNISDFAVSSYTPTLRSLRQPNTTRPYPPRVLIVTQPDVPDHASIPGTIKEAKLVANVATQHNSKFEHLSGDSATPTTVLDCIVQFDWAHLACHGVQHPKDPLQSAFVLADGSLRLGSLMAKSLDNAQLAFLSACQTATGDKTLPEEAVHLTAGMLSAGFQSVVGTMWSIWDEDAPIVAEAFYTQLFKDGTESGWENRPDSALALHEAVKRHLEKVGDMEFMRWVPFVHFGL